MLTGNELPYIITTPTERALAVNQRMTRPRLGKFPWAREAVSRDPALCVGWTA